MPLGSCLQGMGKRRSQRPGRPAGMLPPLPLGCLLPGSYGAAVSLGDCTEPPPACTLLLGVPTTLDLVGREMSPWQPIPSWELAFAEGGQEERRKKRMGHGGVSTVVSELPSPFS